MTKERVNKLIYTYTILKHRCIGTLAEVKVLILLNQMYLSNHMLLFCHASGLCSGLCARSLTRATE